MADITKTISILFTSDTSDAQRKVEDLSQKLQKVDDGGAASQGLNNVSGAIKKVGDEAGPASTSTKLLTDKLKELAEGAGAPREAITGIEAALTKLGLPGVGAGAIATAAVTGFFLAITTYGNSAIRDFTVLNENLSGGLGTSSAEFENLKRIVNALESNLGETGEIYARFLQKISDTGITAEVARNAFQGIAAAIEGTGGSTKDTEKALQKFIDVAKDGNVNLKELEGISSAIPGSLRIFADALGVSKDELRQLADSGNLGSDAIERFARALQEQDYTSLTPIADAFNDLKLKVVETAESLGADGAMGLAIYAIDKAIRAVTLTIVTGGESLAVFGKTVGNLLALLSGNQTGAQFLENQAGIFNEFGEKVTGAFDKLTGLQKALGDNAPSDAGSKYKDLADQIKATGDATENTDEKTKKLSNSLSAAERVQIELAKASSQAERALAQQAETSRKAEEAAGKVFVELNKIASNERIKLIEAKVKLDIANVEANAKRSVAIIESLGKTIESTGKTITDLFGLFADPNTSFRALADIREQIEKEDKRRNIALQLQGDLTRAQIDQLRTQTAQIAKGDAMIRIDGAGLQPHLEAFMWEILRKIQVRVNQDGLKMLLGT